MNRMDLVVWIQRISLGLAVLMIMGYMTAAAVYVLFAWRPDIKAQARWKWGCFKTFRRQFGLIGGLRRTFGNYFVAPIGDDEGFLTEGSVVKGLREAARALRVEGRLLMEEGRAMARYNHSSLSEARRNMKIGDTVIFGPCETGSVGEIHSSRDYDDGFYVKWCYGKDAAGEYWRTTGSVARNDIAPISRELYHQYIDCRCFSDAQKPIYQKMIEELYNKGWIWTTGMGR